MIDPHLNDLRPTTYDLRPMTLATRLRFVPMLFLAACAGTGSRSGAGVEPPNIVVILADDLGIGELGAWGQQEIATPNIDRLARDGMRFTEFRSSAGVCGPARCSLMTGHHNGTCRLDDNDNDYLRPEDVTLAERLRSAGYATGLFGKWGLSWDARPESWPQAQGFDAFFGYRDQVHAHNFYPEYLIDGTDSLRTGNVVPKPTAMGAGQATVKRAYAPDLMRDRAFAFVRANAGRRFFLYWATNLPHIHNEIARTSPDGGYETPTLGAYADKPWPLPKKSYAAQVSRLDQDVGAIRALLDSLGLTRKTLIVFLSDNGATFLKIANDGQSDIARPLVQRHHGIPRLQGRPLRRRAAHPRDLYLARRREAGGQLRRPRRLHRPPRHADAGRGNAGAERHRRTLLRTDHHRTRRLLAAAVSGVVLAGPQPERGVAGRLEGGLDAGHDARLQPGAGSGEQRDLRAAQPAISAELDSIRRVEDRRVQHPVKPR